MDAQQAWKATIEQLKSELPKASFDTWVKQCKFIGWDELSSTMTIGANNAFACDWLDSRLKSTVINKLTGMLALAVNVEFKVHNAPVLKPSAETEQAVTLDANVFEETVFQSEPAEMRARAQRFDSQLNPKYRFDNFVVGPANRLVHAASMAVAEHPAQAYNPLFIYSGVGLGKTHVLHAIGNAVQRQGKEVLYVSSEEFTNDLVGAIRNKTTNAFREKYRRVDVLLIDDIQFIAGKESTQEEFFHTFNTLYGQDKQIVISSDRSPKAMSMLEERLRSRFEWGLTVDMQAPDYETRLAILQSKAEKEGRVVAAEIIELVAKTIQTNIRELEGAWNRVLAFADLMGKQLSLQMAQNALADYAPQPSSLTPDYVVDVVADYFGIEPEKLSGKSRARDVALPRQVAMYLLREDSGISLPRIGKELGGRDHTTVMYACDKVAEMIDSDDMMRRKVSQIRERLHSHKVLA
jgi:chromosomal replication initiator protein